MYRIPGHAESIAGTLWIISKNVFRTVDRVCSLLSSGKGHALANHPLHLTAAAERCRSITTSHQVIPFLGCLIKPPFFDTPLSPWVDPSLFYTSRDWHWRIGLIGGSWRNC